MLSSRAGPSTASLGVVARSTRSHLRTQPGPSNSTAFRSSYQTAPTFQLLYGASTSSLASRTFSTARLPSAVPLVILQPRLRKRHAQLRLISTEPASSRTSDSPPPILPAQRQKQDVEVSRVPPPGTPPPLPPLPLSSIPPKAAELAEKEVKEVKKKEEPKGSLPTRVWATVKKEALHYWHGTKLLGQEIKISAKLQWKVLQGGTLTRRERRQLKRTTTDLLRLLPFSVFVIVPFMEFLLPVALRLFPNMLPSTFEGEFAAAEKQRKLLRVRIEMAKFLQETVRESGLKMDTVVKSDEFKQFFRKVRSTGETPSQTDVVRVAKLFHDDITLDNLSRPQLVSMCKYIGINSFGTDNFLKHQIMTRLEKVRVDDMMIQSEGVDSLTTKELQLACQSRGIRFQGVSPATLREELQQWIELHYTNGISGVLLVLSRAFNFESKGDNVLGALITTLSSLPENLLNEAELGVEEGASFKQKLEVLQQQQELIEDEAEQEQEEEEARKAEEAAKREAKEAKKAAEEAAKKEAEAAAQPAAAAAAEAELVEDKAEAAADDARMTKEQLGELAEALNVLTAKSSIVKERDELAALLEDNLLSEAESKERPDEADQASIAVSKRVRSMIKKIDAQLEKYDEKVGSSLNVIETNDKGQISLADLERALKSIKHAPPEEIISTLGKKLDVDQDGFVELDHVVELTQDRALGIEMEDKEAQDILSTGKDIRQKDMKDLKPKREDIVADE